MNLVIKIVSEQRAPLLVNNSQALLEEIRAGKEQPLKHNVRLTKGLGICFNLVGEVEADVERVYNAPENNENAMLEEAPHHKVTGTFLTSTGLY